MGGKIQSKDELDAKVDVLMDEVAPKEMPSLGNEEELAFWLKAVKKSVVGGSPQSQRLYADYLKLISKEKPTNGFKSSPEDNLKVARDTTRRLQEEYTRKGGMCPVCHRPNPLHDEIRLHSEQEHGTGGEVEALVLSDRPARDNNSIS